MLEESFTFGIRIRKGNWKYIAPFDSTKTLPAWLANKHIAGGFLFEPQLYDLDNESGEQQNMASRYPELVMELREKIEAWKAK